MTNDANKLIEDNINIAHKLAWQYYTRFNKRIEFEELQSISFLGLTKAAKTFNEELTYTFSTYAYKCIINEILLYYRKNKKYITTSFSEELTDNIVLEDTLPSNQNTEEDVLVGLEVNLLYKYIDQLPEIEQKVIYYRLKGKTMEEIGKIVGYSQPQISRLYAKALNRLRNKFMD